MTRAVALAALAGGAILWGAASPAEASVRRYAVIVGNATSIVPDTAPLEYADDDAARYAELFDAVADDVRLLTVLDSVSQRVFPAQARRALPPDRRTLLATLGAVFERMHADRAAGHEVVFYFVLVGHGHVGAGGEGFFSLLDAPFTRSDLYDKVLASSPATTNHVIVDACNSYFVVNQRGTRGPDEVDDGGPAHTAAVAAYVGGLDLSRYPNTGVLLSTSSAKESHEWSALQAGVFSHQVRSALLGAADADGDGRIGYAELHAFVAAANLRVQDPRARVDPYVRPPTIDVTRPIVDLRESRFEHYLAIPAGTPFRFFVEDDRGLRYADVHSAAEAPIYLALVPRRHYWVRTPDQARERRVDLNGLIRVDPSSLRPATIASRGSLAETFRRELFAEPFGPQFFQGFAAAHGYAVAADGQPRWRPPASQADSSAKPRIDRAFLDRKLRALNARAKRDGTLRARLETVAEPVAARLLAGDYAGAALLLDRAASPSAAP